MEGLRITLHRDPKYFLNRDAEQVATMGVSLDVASFFLKNDLGPSQYTVTASLDDRPIGFFRLAVSEVFGAQALGTFVHRDYRRQGIGRAMWKRAMYDLGLEHVQAVAITAEGQAFLQAMASDEDLEGLFLDVAEAS